MEDEISLLVKFKNNIQSQSSALHYYTNNEYIDLLNNYSNKNIEIKNIIEYYNNHKKHYQFLNQNLSKLEKKIHYYLHNNCNHIWVEDEIELKHERITKIKYCLHCELTKDKI